MEHLWSKAMILVTFQRPSHDVPDLAHAMSDGHICHLCACQTASYNHNVGSSAQLHLGFCGWVGQDSNLHGVAGVPNMVDERARDSWTVPSTNGQDHSSCIVQAMVCTNCEQIVVRVEIWYRAEVDVVDCLLLDQILSKTVAVNYAIAVVPEQGS